MPNDEVAALIAQHIPTGLPHPGDPERHQSPMTIPLAAFRTAGMPPEMAEQVQATTKLLGEAIVHLIERSGKQIIDSTELDQLRATDQQPGVPMPVLCSACRQPMLWLNVNNGRAVVNGHVIGSVNPVCPHIPPENSA